MNAQLNDWSDIHFAYQVAKTGTLTAAGEALGVHHSTVLRRIDALERRLGARLFHRHPRGYTATAAGQMLLSTAERTQLDFDRLLGQLQGADEQLNGTLVLTSVNSLEEVLTPLIAEFLRQHPEIKIELVVESRIFKLEFGEAHVSIRPGRKPEDPDYVVQHLATMQSTLYASAAYMKSVGGMKTLNDYQGHRFISTVRKLPNVPAMAWLEETVAPDQIVYRTTDFVGALLAAREGVGIAPLVTWTTRDYADLIPLLKPPESWLTNLWLVTHRDIHHTAKVQAFTQFLKTKVSRPR